MGEWSPPTSSHSPGTPEGGALGRGTDRTQHPAKPALPTERRGLRDPKLPGVSLGFVASVWSQIPGRYGGPESEPGRGPLTPQRGLPGQGREVPMRAPGRADPPAAGHTFPGTTFKLPRRSGASPGQQGREIRGPVGTGVAGGAAPRATYLNAPGWALPGGKGTQGQPGPRPPPGPKRPGAGPSAVQAPRVPTGDPRAAARPARPGPARLRRRREAQPAGPARRGSRPRLRSRPGPAGGTHLRSPAVPPQSPRPGRRGPGPPRLRRPVHNFCLRRAAPLPPPAPVALPRARPLPRPRVRRRLRHLRNVAPDQARGCGAPGAHAALRIGRPDYGSQRPARRR